LVLFMFVQNTKFLQKKQENSILFCDYVMEIVNWYHRSVKKYICWW